ncbi:MAG: VOC family protein [Verrucomicrobiota bacterium JB023]|nr:VOC family protein [Verrucomicrobiota bacterium JB023]
MNPKDNPVGWFEIYVDDLERAKSFYESVFAIKLELLPCPEGSPDCPTPQMLQFPSDHPRPGAAGALVKMEGMPPGPGGTLVYFSCEDCAIEAARAQDSGGELVQGKFPIGEYGFIAIIKDSEGNVIGLHSPPAESDC